VNSQDAAADLETIRVLMERSALYRRTLAPVCLAMGLLGAGAGVAHRWVALETSTAFALWWLGTGAVAVAVAFGIARRQAIKDGEGFWSPPTRRVAASMLPALAAGFLVSVPFLLGEDWARRVVWLLPALWMVLYGCALHAAGFFMTGGIRGLGWAYVVAGSGLLLWWTCPLNQFPPVAHAHLAMAVGFGVGHAGYGLGLGLAERSPKT
jgi:hypothetical protein